jgi:predicted nucleic acid-binding protein
VILADTSIWIDHLHHANPDLHQFLERGRIVMHPFIVAEVALGSLRNRRKTFAFMERVAQVEVVHLDEVRSMIEVHSLYSRGIGLTDAHLIASCLIAPGTRLWTRDARLQAVAESLGVDSGLKISRAN